MTLHIAGLELKCLRSGQNADGYPLYMVTNMDELMRSAENEQALSGWMAHAAAEEKEPRKKQGFDETQKLISE